MIDEKLLEKFYSKIFSVPKKRVSIAIGVTSIILASYLNGISGKSFFVMRYFFIGLALIILLLIFGKLLESGFNSRRTFFLALFFLILIEIADIIAIHLTNPDYIIISPSVVAFILTIALYFTSKKFSYSAPLIILLVLYPVDYIFSFSAPHRTLAYTISTIAGIFFGHLFIRYLGRDEELKIPELLRSFVLYWLKGLPEIFETALKKFSRIHTGRVHLIKVGKWSIIAPEFHPGPFRDIGGAKLVNEALKYHSMFLHAVSTHSTNPVSREEVERIVNVAGDYEETSFMKPYSVSGKNFMLKVYPAEDFTLLIIHGKERIDDIPQEIRLMAENFFKNPVVIDAHNAYMSRYQITPEDLTEIYFLMEEASKKPKEKCNELKVYYSSEDYENERICGKLALLVMSFDGELHGILMIDSNNMEKTLRDYLADVGREYGIELDIITTDNHSKTGISPKIGYMPANMEDAEIIESFLKKALENMDLKDAGVLYSSEDVQIRTMGEEFFKKMDFAFRKYGESGLYLFGVFSALNYIISFILAGIIL
ncbi:DUF2070 family protein [Geoglobus acetivorans]|uniref:DUF2070 domain-containing protein n=1 Tax=Geoglobus acetivorans TaxID=565033 RepID=A0A0A7GCB8_GEOAI|nr:hypothetical protein GACE_0425 [Geoglobus acetivorans]